MQNRPKEYLREILNDSDILFKLANTGSSNQFLNEEEIDTLKEGLESKTQFIKLFKPDINEITLKTTLVEKKADTTLYAVNQMIHYHDHAIDLEYESFGIKKLIRLYSAIKHVTNGGILVIDELDSHINDVYLVKLISYISRHAKGQLIFTTHNISPMEILKTKKMAIDFMSSSSTVSTWTQQGNYSPSRVYQNGLIRGLPFNIDEEDFARVFLNE